MTTAKPDLAAEQQGLQQRRARIGKQLLEAMGCPAGLQGVRVRPLWGNYYRVNVLVGADAATARIVHSYFLSADEDGTIRTATPALTRRYEATTGGGA
jgi:hypothetical protein